MRQPAFDRIPATTLLIVAVGEEDLVVGDLRGRQIFAEATAIPPSRKRFILFRSDRHGYPPLIAEHTAPTGTNPRLDNGEGILRSLQLSLGDVNALDHAGFWRITDSPWRPPSPARPSTTSRATRNDSGTSATGATAAASSRRSWATTSTPSPASSPATA